MYTIRKCTLRNIRLGKVDLVFHISHLLDLCVAGSHYSLFVTSKININATIFRKNYHATAIKSGCVMVWKAIMTAEVAGLGIVTKLPVGFRVLTDKEKSEEVSPP